MRQREPGPEPSAKNDVSIGSVDESHESLGTRRDLCLLRELRELREAVTSYRSITGVEADGFRFKVPPDVLNEIFERILGADDWYVANDVKYSPFLLHSEK